MKKLKNLLVIDGSALLNTIFFASISDIQKQIKDIDMLDNIIDSYFRTGNGHYTENIGSFISTVVELRNMTYASHVVVCFDKDSQSTFRKQEFSYYKANRPSKPKAIKDQMEVLHFLLKQIGVACFWSAKYEADDLAGSIIREFKHDFDIVYFYTKDRDWFQLIDTNVKGIVPMGSIEVADDLRIELCKTPENNTLIRGAVKMRGRMVCIDKAGCMRLCNVYPAQIADYKALAGDTADNIPGAKGIGEQTAIALLTQLCSDVDTLFEILKDEDEKSFKQIAKKCGIRRNPYKTLVENEKTIRDSLKLATIITHIDCSRLKIDNLAWHLDIDVLKEAIWVYNLENDLDWVVS